VLHDFLDTCPRDTTDGATEGKYDNNSDDDIDDGGDDLAVSEDFGGSSVSPSNDYAGNLIDDGTFVYVYDAWNRLVKVRAKQDSGITVQTANFDGLGRRMKKAVTNSGDQDATVVYLYDGQKIIQANDGSGNMVQQFIHGTQYIDELVMVRVKDKGDLYVHQDANWNVIGLSDLGGHLVERYKYSPYGEVAVDQVTGFGDRDGDSTVNSTDKGTVGVTCTGTVSGACRILDLNFDGVYDSTDAGLFNYLPQGSQKRPGKQSSGVSQPFAHQGLLFEPEIASYQNRARQYDPAKRRFMQRDTLEQFATATLYEYVASNPMINVDLNGKVCMTYCNGQYVPCGGMPSKSASPGPNSCSLVCGGSATCNNEGDHSNSCQKLNNMCDSCSRD